MDNIQQAEKNERTVRQRDYADLIPAIVIVTLCAVMFLSGTFLRDAWGPDEARYAEVAREMVDSGNYILPHLNFQVYADKPPLIFWLMALSASILGGFSTFAIVLPSALAGACTVVLIYFLANDMFQNRRAAFLSCLVLATSVQFFHVSQFGRIDMLLCFFETLAVYAFWLWYTRGQRRFLGVFYVAMAFAILAKGPVGLLPIPVAIAFLIWSGQKSLIRRMALVPGLLAVAAIVACWFLPAAAAGGKPYWQEILGLQIVGRLHNSWSHSEPFYFYIENFPADALPWFVLIPAALVRYVKDATVRDRLFMKFIVAWFLTIFVVFSLISGKRNVYLLPLYPAFALFVGYYLDYAISAGKPKVRELKLYLGLLFTAAVGAGIALAVLPAVTDIPVRPALCFAGSAVLAVTGLFGLIALRAKTFRPAMVAVGCLLVIVLAGDTVALSISNKRESAKPLGLAIHAARQDAEPVAVFGGYRAEYSFHVGLPIEQLATDKELRQFMAQPTGAFCIAKKDALDKLDQPLAESIETLGAFTVGSRNLVLLYDPPDSETAQ
ncbi:MAG: glycosyltransferase family 39 protein [Candidatus Hydrogenedentes bacterium]|nr:glycosyltransferase family 39 protein [Candidatus Hydrogenedentota bacterium]